MKYNSYIDKILSYRYFKKGRPNWSVKKCFYKK